MSSAPQGSGRRRRVPTLRLSETSSGRLPLRAVPPDVERAQKRRDAVDAAAIDEFAAGPDTAHRASNLNCGISPWNARPRPQPSAAYWSPLPDPQPKAEQGWRWSPYNGRLHRRY